ncbi:uncharacterized protein BXZ73DRAFT_98086 [Epithele typhae]|uniref:uncharacterized protein n=1 Tax=Epithele typhae TaxID=378194 RepID=UPI002008E17A|nr:uncharacterized protein BXZ73DRAFT_98086 [Epithele typhae]KAH9941695.1 hypothetical protein BXZ73DRAFT_98086 [Epithele typhae]
MDERVLALLARVNVLTTLVPHRADALEQPEFRGFQLAPWARHEQRKQWPTEWRWQYDSRGNANPTNTSRGVSYEFTLGIGVTRNYVELPTVIKQGALSIRIGGQVQLSISLQDSKSYAHGPVSRPTAPAVLTAPVPLARSATPADPAKLLADAFPPKVDLDGLVRELRAFEGAWRYCFPLASLVFHADGDLLFELRQHGTGAGEGDGGRRLPHRKRAPLAFASGTAPELLRLATPRVGAGVANGSGAYNGSGNPILKESIGAALESPEHAPSKLEVGDELQASISVSE